MSSPQRAMQTLRPAGGQKPASDIPSGLIHDTAKVPANYQVSASVTELINEWRHLVRLLKADCYPTQSVLFHGPTGTGKSTAGRAIAAELQLPLYVMMLSQTIGSYLGETGQSISAALTFCMQAPCVLLMDEIDALAIGRKAGGNSSASSEMYRTVNGLIQLLDVWHEKESGSILIGTTNMFDKIDPAIRRRFEMDVEIPRASHRELCEFAGCDLPRDLEMSFGELKRLTTLAKRRAVIDGVDYALALGMLVEAKT